MKLAAKVTGIESVQAEVSRLTAKGLDLLKGAVAESAEAVAGRVKSNLSGRVLGGKGTLRNSVSVRFFQSQSAVWAQVGADWYPGGFWERGSRGQQDVRSYYRSVKHGPAMKLMRYTRRGKLRTVRNFKTGAVRVSAYHRVTDGTPRQFLRPENQAEAPVLRSKVADIAGGSI
jgi:CTP-dependent riboflavin kinase